MIKKIAVIGAGQMGSGIAQVAAATGYSVLLNDISDEILKKAFSKIESFLAKSVEKEKISPDEMKQTLENITISSKINKISECDFIIEAATENIDLKLKIFKQLDEQSSKDAIIASNTSSISITKIAGATSRPEKIIGMHFMNPVPIMKLVEIIPGLATSTDTLSQTLELAKQMGKVTTQSKDISGFIANRILMPYINEAIQALYEGIGSIEDIDTTMKLGTNVPMGPLTLADFIGLDTCLAIMNVLHEGFSDSKYRPSPLLVKYVEAGWYGKKSGRGFYTYEK
ncbi:MAG: 3-hydroxybutyryl-CoA dehydrogenase [Calditrichaeota bacterium]|nr:3-hydroxybutyryl-CoA dehydrogenase [Calditrichota bacterium]